jgi:putative transposon-encoded protein
MQSLFESKVRRVGSSLGLLIPKEVAELQHLSEGKRVTVVILKRDLRAIDELFGIAKGARPFVREHDDRQFR